MGDRTHIKLYSGLLEYLEQHGRSLSEYGSAERGLGIVSALTFLELLRINQVPLLGVELWRSHGDHLELDVSEIWYSSSSDPTTCYADAERYFDRAKTGAGDVFAIQFG